MNGTPQEVDGQRTRWERYRRGQQMVEDAGERFGAGGLGRHVEDLTLRLLVLPSDSAGDAVPFDT